MNSYIPLIEYLKRNDQTTWADELAEVLEVTFNDDSHGLMTRWKQSLDKLPAIKPSTVSLKTDVSIGAAKEINSAERDSLKTELMNFHPWRKGPYNLFDIHINTEWRSDWKWERLLPHIQSLKGRKVLDVGGGNGYHGWRMLGEEAEIVLGIDPTLVFVMQYHVMQRYIESEKHFVVPIGIEALPQNLQFFDTAFSMGVLYHRRSPIDHLYDLRSCLRPGGELVLETLVIDGQLGDTLMPASRYAKMRNVWFLPSIPTMILWLERSGFKNVRCVDVDVTSLEEQRSTDWMTFESLADFLDPNDINKTIEGYPAPKRAIFLADAP
jgi:tRNA (mo5U34)-methyltransferase